MAARNGQTFGSVQQKLIAAAGFSNEEATDLVKKIFSEYATEDGKTMSLAGFTDLIQAYPGLIPDPDRIASYFRAFDDRYHGHLLYNQFLTGLAALDPSTSHGHELGEIRSRYIFRFYCSQHSSKGIMGEADFRTLAKDIVRLKEPSIADNVAEVNRRAGPYFQHFELDMTMTKFVSKIGSLQLRGTSVLFRAASPVLQYLTETRTKAMKEGDTAMDYAESETGKDACIQTENEFTISQSAVYITNSGCVLQRLSESFGVTEEREPAAVTQNTASVLRQQDGPDSGEERQKAIGCAIDFLRGLDYFYRPYTLKSKQQMANSGGSAGQNNQDNEVVQRKAALDWHDVKKPKLANCLIRLCRYLQPILAAESRCLELKQPIYILGDLHGNFDDLHEFERLLWPMGPEHCIADILFLGDYVDRGQYGMEVIAYLFAVKILAPNKVFLLRGNHELRDQQAVFSFKKECLDKLGNDGERVWNAINGCFDRMPLAAVIDEKIFCVHGGIPHPTLLETVPESLKDNVVDMINYVCPCPADSFSFTSIPWELMWNDPVWEDVTAIQFDRYGFRKNSKRGTGHEFTAEALDAFLNQFGLSHIIRAHQVHATGFQIRYNAKCLTVFSSSMYSGLENEAAVIMVNEGVIRIMRVSLRSGLTPVTEKENADRQDQAALSRKNVGVFAKR